MSVFGFMDNVEERSLAIFKWLFDDERWWAVTEIAAKENCSVDSVYASIQSLKEVSESSYPYFEITTQKGKGFMMITKPGCSYINLRGVYFENTLTYQIINRIFHTPHVTIEMLVQELFVSKSTIYRKIRLIEKIVGQNNLVFDSSKLEISGDELIIREFYYFVYWTLARSSTWPFIGAPKDLLLHRLDEALRDSPNKISPADKMKLIYRLSINFIRQQQRHFITSLPEEYLDPYRSVYLPQLMTAVAESIPSPYRELEAKYLLLLVTTYPVVHEKEVAHQQIIDWHQEQGTLAYKLAKTILDQLDLAYPNDKISQNNQVLFQLICNCIYALVFDDSLIETRLGNQQVADYNKRNPHFYHYLSTAIKKIVQQPEFNKKLSNANYLIFCSYTILDSLYNLNSFETTIYVKIVCADDPTYEPSLREALLAKSAANLVVHISEDQPEGTIEYDLLIYDYQPDIFPAEHVHSKRVYTWDFPPSDRNWNQVLSFIEKAKSEKSPSIIVD